MARRSAANDAASAFVDLQRLAVRPGRRGSRKVATPVPAAAFLAGERSRRHRQRHQRRIGRRPRSEGERLQPRHRLLEAATAALDAERWLSENQLATGGDDEAAEECMPEDYESWTMKQIRKELKERGVDVGAECRGCSEKREFIEVLCRHM